MNKTLNYLRGGRKWFVPNLTVWGSNSSYQMPMFLIEETSPKRLIYCLAELGGEDQIVKYSDLVDSLGNYLPEIISNPIVVIIPKGESSCYLVGRPSGTGFKIAHGQTSSKAVVDILVMEVDSL